MKGKSPKTTADQHTSRNGDSNMSSAPDPKRRSVSAGGPVDNSTSGRNPIPKHYKSKASRKNRPRRRTYFFDLLYYCSFIFLAIYAVSVCSTDSGPEHRLCRFIYGYRQRVLEPLVVRPIRGALTHPYVSPFVARVEPHLQRAINSASPVISRARREGTYRISSQWNKRVMPQWRRYAVPYLRRLDRTLKPYQSRIIKEYNDRVAPSLKIARRHLRRYKRNAQVYVNFLTLKIQEGYKTAEPYVMSTLRQSEAYFTRGLLVLRKQRRRFVDPHVAKIWDKVKELSSGKAKGTLVVPGQTSLSPSAATIPLSSSVKEDVQPMSKSPPPSHISTALTKHTDEPASPSATHITTSTTEEAISTSVSHQITPESTGGGHADPTDATTVLETLESVYSLVSETLHHIPTVTPAMASLTEEIHSAVTSAAASLSSQKETEQDDPTLDQFFADLGLVDEIPENIVLEDATTEGQPGDTDFSDDDAEMQRLKTENTAMKRSNIMARHLKWEKQLEAFIENKITELREALLEMRKTAVTELRESKVTRSQVEILDSEGKKYLKGAESYLQNLQKEEKSDEDKNRLWSRVITKVEEKFSEKTRQVEGVVNNWTRELILREQDVVRRAHSSVKEYSEQAQADLGLDYAWLDDVTYLDWQRYHDLVGRSDRFVDQAIAIQNGSHPSPVDNPVFPALNDLSSELGDLIFGFNTRLRQIQRTAARIFNSGPDGSTVNNDTPEPEPEFSILPVPDAETPGDVNEKEVPPVILGRGKEEVLEALGRSETHEAIAKTSEGVVTATHEAEPDSDMPTSECRDEL